MLHENAKQRIRNLIPREYELTWFDPLLGETYEDTIELGNRQIRWDRDDSPTKYPTVILQFSPEGSPRGDVGHIFRNGIYKFPVPEDETIAYIQVNAQPMTGTLNVTVAAQQDHHVEGGDGAIIPQRAVADSIAMQVFHELTFESRHLRQPGEKPGGDPLEYAWPMALRGIDHEGMIDTSTMVDEQAIQRRVLPFRLDYGYFAEKEVPAVAAIEYGLFIDGNLDGEFTEHYDEEVIVFYEWPQDD